MSTSVPPPGHTEDAPAPASEEPQRPPRSPAASTRRGRSRLLAGGAAVVVLAGLGFFLLGSKGTHLNSDPVAQAATLSSSVAGYRMRMSLEMTSSELSPITATGKGVVDLRDHATSLSLAMNLGDEPQVVQALGSSTLHMDMVTDGAVVYVKLPSALTSAMAAGGKPWVKIDLTKLAGIPGLSSLGSNPTTSDPSDVLQALRSVSDSVVAEGGQRVDGVETTHYRADLSLEHLVGAVPSADRAAVQQALSTLEQATGTDKIPVDVWVDSQHLVRRFEMSMDVSAPTGPAMTETVKVDLGD